MAEFLRIADLPEYQPWGGMKARCYYRKSINFKSYGGRGITVCERWKNDFFTFLLDMGIRPPGTSLDRINPNGNYEPANCRWATRKEQGRNRRDNVLIDFRGQRMTLTEAAEITGVPLPTAYWRVKRGITGDDVVKVGPLVIREKYNPPKRDRIKCLKCGWHSSRVPERRGVCFRCGNVDLVFPKEIKLLRASGNLPNEGKRTGKKD